MTLEPSSSTARRCLRQTISAGIVLTTLLLYSSRAIAWRSPASCTESDIARQSLALTMALEETGRLPTAKYWKGHADYYDPNNRFLSATGAPLDQWGRPYLYRIPGLHGSFDLYSAGINGIDDQGGCDDISNWAGVNEGYYYKSTWPRGRLTIGGGIALSLLSLSLAIVFPWRIVLPVAATILSLAVSLGCLWLMHPGIVPTRNASLSAYCFLAAGIFTTSLIYLVRILRTDGLTMIRRTAPPSILTPD